MSLTRIRQRRFGGPDADIVDQGDCWATAIACFAGLTERDRNELHRRIVLSDLALQRHQKDPLEGGNWWNVTLRFLDQRGLQPLGWTTGEVPVDRLRVWIASGPSPRGDFYHSILAYGDSTLYWDPHPSGVGLPAIEEWCGWWKPPVDGDTEAPEGRIFGAELAQEAA